MIFYLNRLFLFIFIAFLSSNCFALDEEDAKYFTNELASKDISLSRQKVLAEQALQLVCLKDSSVTLRTLAGLTINILRIRNLGDEIYKQTTAIIFNRGLMSQGGKDLSVSYCCKLSQLILKRLISTSYAPEIIKIAYDYTLDESTPSAIRAFTAFEIFTYKEAEIYYPRLIQHTYLLIANQSVQFQYRGELALRILDSNPPEDIYKFIIQNSSQFLRNDTLEAELKGLIADRMLGAYVIKGIELDPFDKRLIAGFMSKEDISLDVRAFLAAGLLNGEKEMTSIAVTAILKAITFIKDPRVSLDRKIQLVEALRRVPLPPMTQEVITNKLLHSCVDEELDPDRRAYLFQLLMNFRNISAILRKDIIESGLELLRTQKHLLREPRALAFILQPEGGKAVADILKGAK